MAKEPKKSLLSHARSKRFVLPRVKKKKVNALNEDKLPRITNDTVSKHREEVISGAKKYVYPLKHSQHKIVIISVSILVVLLLAFTTSVLYGLYKMQLTTPFIYQITKVIPLPVAKIGGTLVPYEDYLFELRHYIYYFENQIDVDFASEQGKEQLIEQKKRTMEDVINNAYARKIARENNISVSDQEVADQVALLREQNLIGSDQDVLEDVLKSFYDWDVKDFERSIRQQLLNAKVAQHLDPSVQQKAQKALSEIRAGKDFAQAAKEYSEDDITKDSGGDIGVVDSTKAYMRQEYAALKSMKEGGVSDVVQLDDGLAIVKHLGEANGKIKAAHIIFKYKELNEYLNDIKSEQPATVYIKN